MKKKRLLSLITAASMLLSMTGITASAESGGKKTVSQMVSEMTTEQKVEQMMIITLRQWSDGETFEKSYKFNDEQIRFIQRHNFGGICLFASNVHDTKQTVELTSDIQHTTGVLSIQGKDFKSDCRRLLNEEHRITTEEFEELEDEYEVYTGLGGNGRGAALFDAVKTKYMAQLGK